jgi:peptidyl-prolyl cis-trans isomerase D
LNVIFKKIGKIGSGDKFSMKGLIATVVFGAIIAVFALTDLSQNRGESGSGVAAVVNDTAITLAEYRGRVDNLEQNAKGRFDQFPEEQRRMLSQQMRRRALDELILGELVYQAGSSKGVRAADAEIRDTILEIPFLNENGRFMKDRYRMFLQNMNLSSEDFEHQIRKQIVTQKMQELFVGAATPTREELRRSRMLANQKVNVRFVELAPEDWHRPGVVPNDKVQEYLNANRTQVEKYYNDNKIEFTDQERVKARHILVRIDDKRPAAEASRVATDLKAKLSAANFSKMAAQHSDDPGSKAKGGELGEFSRGRMIPEFENVVFAMKEGQISDPVQTNFGYHIILLDKKLPSLTKPLAAVEPDIARKLYAQSKHGEIVAGLRSMVEKGNKTEVDGWVNRAGLKWVESGEFDLSSVQVPKLGDSPAVVGAVLRKGKTGGLVNQLIDNTGRQVIVDVISWKETPDKGPGEEVEGLDRMVAFRKSNDLIETWSRDIQTKASIQRNPRITQQ